MEAKDIFIDYYKVLQCEKTASNEELKRSYQRLALSSHPDKITSDCEQDTFLLVQKAWTVLRDPETRRQYDAEFSCKEHSELLLYDTISLSDMEFNAIEITYSYSCRCGGTYLLEANNLRTSNLVIGCDECSFSIQINL